tara:strand:- start:553 stop:1062 length:510 start_codon:yes stop_codon:yes gene_type:complete
MNKQNNAEIHLRPRFKIEIDESSDVLIEKFKQKLKEGEKTCLCKIIGNHIVIDVSAEENKFWSPQLGLEIERISENRALIKGLFGPKPQVWTLFMFLHFAIAFAFIAAAIVFYVKWSLKTPFTVDLVLLILLPVIWVVLYFLGRFGKKKGHYQMNKLYTFMIKVLEINR